MAHEASSDLGARGSSGSGRSSGPRRLNPQQQLHQIEKSVTHLLVATKQLLETLTLWSRGGATEGEVSDVYVRLGYEFNIACRAFNAIGVETSDLGPVPDLLRSILEDTLSQEASQSSLDRFLPRIRDIIINLLQGLKKKQARLRARAARESDRTPGSSSRQDSFDVATSDVIQQEVPPARTLSGSSRSVPPRQGSRDIPPNASEPPPRITTREDGRSSPPFSNSGRPERFENESDSTLSSRTAQNIPVIAPYPQEDTIPTGPTMGPTPPRHSIVQNFPHPPPPPPKQQDALLTLQRTGDLERRASRRFSTYQINKQLGAANGIPMLPSQNSPIPNRGREARESIQAVRPRGSQLYQRQKSERRLVGEQSPSRSVPPRISEEELQPTFGQSTVSLPADGRAPSVPTLGKVLTYDDDNTSVTGVVGVNELAGSEVQSSAPAAIPARRSSRKERTSSPASQQFGPDDSPQPGKPLTLFLQYKSQVKKVILDDGFNDLSIARLQLAFIDKFAWNTHNNGVDLPDIYIQDSSTGVRYELEDLNDIKNNTVLVLNVEPLDEVKRHIDDGLSGLRRIVEGIKTAVDDQQSAIQRVSDRQQEAAKGIAGLVVAPISAMPSTQLSSKRPMSPVKGGMNQLTEIQTLRRDLAVMRQTYSSFVSDVNASMAAVRTKAASVKSVAVKVSLPDLSGDSGRAYINKGLYDQLSKEQTTIVERVDEVQDLIEDLRKDVVTRGVRPLPRQLEQVAKDLSNATAGVKRLEAYLSKEKPLWTKIWKSELQQVCDDKDAVADSEALVNDMKHDLEEADVTFRLVEEACRQQNMSAPENAGSGPALPSRNISGNARFAALAMDQAVDPRKAKDGVLGEVKGLTIDHDSRLEAIERAEKARQKELEGRDDGEFKKELGNFVEEGKLKKSGGVEEAERLRKAKDERIRREVWERMNGGAAGPPPGPMEEQQPSGELEVQQGGTSDATTPDQKFVDAAEAPLPLTTKPA
ncbi:AIP3-domain-containing protein [Trichodelitschia bisporula]|uniref:AIP3-domain-containing protein n=1 Tax=Trichodelitschia bisporula TaxID=703511 RepID=A0A6G1HTP9_9PEZI|nr:AIP3-domain-containing protein [Trichodelitschia bisporula]